MNEVVAKGAFLSKVRPPFMPQYRRSSTKANIHHCFYCVSKHMTKAHDKSAWQKWHCRITACANNNWCEVGVLSKEISQLSKIRPTPSFSIQLSSSPMGIFSRDYGIYIYRYTHICMCDPNKGTCKTNYATSKQWTIYIGLRPASGLIGDIIHLHDWVLPDQWTLATATMQRYSTILINESNKFSQQFCKQYCQVATRGLARHQRL